MKHPLSEFEEPVHGATRALYTDREEHILYLKGFPADILFLGLSAYRFFEDDVLLDQEIKKIYK